MDKPGLFHFLAKNGHSIRLDFLSKTQNFIYKPYFLSFLATIDSFYLYWTPLLSNSWHKLPKKFSLIVESTLFFHIFY